MKFLSDAEWQALLDKAAQAEKTSAGIAAVTAERDGFKTRAEAAETALTAAQTKLTEMEASHTAAVTKLTTDHTAAVEALKTAHAEELKQTKAGVETVASKKAADIAKTAGLDAPIPESTTAATATDIAGLREKLATETDPTKRANIAREIRKLTDAAKSKK